jgi:MoxR-like ATPase
MGETGIGKTSLIRLMAKIMEFPLKIMNIHAGITSK